MWTHEEIEAERDEHYRRAREVNAQQLERDESARCDWCGKKNCECDDDLFDADELGLDPELDCGI